MAFEHVTVVAGDVVYDGWETVIIEADINAGYVNVLLTTTEITPIGASTREAFDKWNFPPGTPIDIYAGNDLVVSAIVWQYAPSADATQHSITVYARTASYGFVNSSIDPRPSGGNYENKTTHSLIAEWLQAHGINWLAFGNAVTVPIWQLRHGATGYEEALRMLKPRGQMIFGLMDGGIAISDGQAMGVQGPLVQGENIERMAAQLTDDQYRERIVTGQTSQGTDLTQALQPSALSSSNLKSRRLKLITEPAAIDKERALQRVDWESRREHGATVQAVITAPGWHSPSGESYVPRNLPPGEEGRGGMGPLWMLMADTYIFAPWLKIDCVMRSTKVVFKQSLSEGTTTELTFTDPAAFSTTPALCNSGSMWLPKFNIGNLFSPPGIGHR